jgi:hypothetical protein
MKFNKHFKEKGIRGSRLKTVTDLIQFHLESCNDTLQHLKMSPLKLLKESNSKKEGVILFLESELRGYHNIRDYLSEISNQYTVSLFRGAKVSKLCKELHREVEFHKETISTLSLNSTAEYYVSLGLLKAYRTALHVLVAVFNIRVSDLKNFDVDQAIADKIMFNTTNETEEE